MKTFEGLTGRHGRVTAMIDTGNTVIPDSKRVAGGGGITTVNR